MPLYETIIIAKAGPAQESVYLLRHLVNGLFGKFPTAKVRDVQNLGDRIMGKALKKDQLQHHVGRYLQIIYDAHPAANQELYKLSLMPPFNKEVFRMYSHKLKDEDYPIYMYMKAARLSDLLGTDPEFHNLEYAKQVSGLNRF